MKTKLLSLVLLSSALSPAFAASTSTGNPQDTPTADFIDNKDGTVTHKKTGLTWQRCSVGQTWTGSRCDGTATRINNSDFTKNPELIPYSFAGKSAWRLPRIDELFSVVEHAKSNPSINETIFPSTPADYWKPFWSSTKNNTYLNSFLGVEFSNGRLRNDSGGNTYVRLVRSDSPNGSKEITPTTDFIDNNDGTVTHTKTGLMWSRCSVGQTWSGFSCDGIYSSLTYDNAVKETSSLGGFSDWRLPTLSELFTITEFTYSKPAINTVIFTDTPSGAPYWTSTATDSQTRSSNKFTIETNNGLLGWDDVTNVRNKNAVRLVRNTLSATVTPEITTPTVTQPVVIPPVVITPPASNVDLTSTISANLNSVNIGSDLTYTATVSNQGTTTANDVSLVYMMPPRWTNFSSIPSGCSVNGANVTCSLGSVNAGSSVSNSITVNFSRRGATSVGALVKTDNDTNNSNNMNRIITTITKY